MDYIDQELLKQLKLTPHKTITLKIPLLVEEREEIGVFCTSITVSPLNFKLVRRAKKYSNPRPKKSRRTQFLKASKIIDKIIQEGGPEPTKPALPRRNRRFNPQVGKILEFLEREKEHSCIEAEKLLEEGRRLFPEMGGGLYINTFIKTDSGVVIKGPVYKHKDEQNRIMCDCGRVINLTSPGNFRIHEKTVIHREFVLKNFGIMI